MRYTRILLFSIFIIYLLLLSLGKMSQILKLNLSRAFSEEYYFPWLYSRLRFKYLNETTLNQKIPWIPYEAKKMVG